MFARGCRGGEWGMGARRGRVSSVGDENVPELDDDEGCTALQIH